MFASVVFFPTCVAFIFRSPCLFIVAPMTASPCFFATGTLSPVIADSSTADIPWTTMPSTGIRCPGFIISMSPVLTSSMGICFSIPSRRIVAVCGCRLMSCLSASDAFPLTTASSHLPRSMNVMMTVDVSK